MKKTCSFEGCLYAKTYYQLWRGQELHPIKPKPAKVRSQ